MKKQVKMGAFDDDNEIIYRESLERLKLIFMKNLVSFNKQEMA